MDRINVYEFKDDEMLFGGNKRRPKKANAKSDIQAFDPLSNRWMNFRQFESQYKVLVKCQYPFFTMPQIKSKVKELWKKTSRKRMVKAGQMQKPRSGSRRSEAVSRDANRLVTATVSRPKKTTVIRPATPTSPETPSPVTASPSPPPYHLRSTIQPGETSSSNNSFSSLDNSSSPSRSLQQTQSSGSLSSVDLPRLSPVVQTSLSVDKINKNSALRKKRIGQSSDPLHIVVPCDSSSDVMCGLFDFLY